MTLRFGTDGVRGHADTELTPHLVTALGPRRGAGAGRRSGRDRSGHAGLRAPHRGRPRGRPRRRRVDRRQRRRRPHPGRGPRLDDPVRDRGHDLGLPQRLRRQRHQVLRRRRAEAERRGRGTSGGRARRPAPRARSRRPRPRTRSTTRSAPPGSTPWWLRSRTAPWRASTWSWTAPTARRRAGRRAPSNGSEPRVEVIHASPDGTNINAGCGSTHPEDLQARVLAVGADAGLAFDGDADRVLGVDADGRAGRRRSPHRHLRRGPSPAGRAGRRHRRGDGDGQPRLPLGHGGQRHPGRGDRGRRPVRARSVGPRWLVPRGRAVRPRHLPRAGHDRGRPAHRRPGPGRRAGRGPDPGRGGHAS